MNRAETRRIQKKLGLQKHVRSLSRNEKFERIRQNIITGKKKEEEMKDVIRLQSNAKKEIVDNSKISSLATELMIKEGLSYIDALEKAKKTYVS